MVPEGWIGAPVKDFGVVNAGRQRSPKFKDGSVRQYLRVANVFDDKICTKDILSMRFTEKEYEKYQLHHGDILLNEGQSVELVGRPAMYTGFPEECCFQNTLVRFRGNNKVDRDYALQRFRLCLYDGTFQGIAKKTTSIAHLGVSRFAELQLCWPPLTEQRKIAKILNTWDKAIATTEKLIEASKQQKKALMQQLLTGKKRFAGFVGEWEITPISQLITESRTSGTNGERARKLTVKLYGRGVTEKKEKRLGSASTTYYKRKAGQFIYSKLDFLNGAFGIIPKHLDGFESTLDLPAFDFTQNVTPKWFIEFVSRDDFYTSNLGLANGGRKARRVNPKDLLQVKVHVPLLDEQQKIASVLTAADQEIETLETKLTHLKQEKKALMQQLLTGKRRVKVEQNGIKQGES